MSGIDTPAILLKSFRVLIPLVGVERIKNFGWERSIDDGANFLKGRRSASRKNLHRHISQCGGFGRSGQDSSSRGVGSQLIQQSILRSAADDTNLVDAFPDDVFQVPENKTIFEGEALQNSSDVCARVLRNGLVGPSAELVDGREHIRRAQEGFIVGVDEMMKRGLVEQPVRSIRDSRRIGPRAVHACRQPCSIHRPITFFSSRVVPFTPPSLVKFMRKASGVMTGESSSVPNSDQVPELRKAVPSRADIAATAEPVS